MPGLREFSDLAPTQTGITVNSPGSQFNAPAACIVDSAVPAFFAISKPVVNLSDSAAQRTVTLQGEHFGANQGRVWAERSGLSTNLSNMVGGSHGTATF